jgi:pyruvate/2-oxoglutarate dehydrogenase complex dihydrolipoamide acyltransferase (E2) component
MPQILRIPKVAVSMREGTLVQWLVPNESVVAEGQPIFTLELEKSTMDVEAPAAGLIRQTGLAGTTYKVGDIIGEIGEASIPTAPDKAFFQRTPVARLVQVVADLDTAMQHWRDTLGAGPFFVFPHLTFANYHHHGSAVASPDISIAVGSAGDLLIELVSQHDSADSAWREAGIGTLMIAVKADDWDAILSAHERAGNVRVAQGAYPFGARFAIIDTRKATSQWLVILENHFVLNQISDKIRAAGRSWDGQSLTSKL